MSGNGGKQCVQIAAFHEDIVGCEGKAHLIIASLCIEKLAPGQNIGLFLHNYLQGEWAVQLGPMCRVRSSLIPWSCARSILGCFHQMLKRQLSPYYQEHIHGCAFSHLPRSCQATMDASAKSQALFSWPTQRQIALLRIVQPIRAAIVCLQ